MKSKRMTITIDYKAGSKRQERTVNELMPMMLDLFEDHYLKSHRHNEIKITIKE